MLVTMSDDRLCFEMLKWLRLLCGYVFNESCSAENLFSHRKTSKKKNEALIKTHLSPLTACDSTQSEKRNIGHRGGTL